MTEFIARLEKTRKKLLDLTKRNKLISYKRPSKSRRLNIIDESAQFLYKNLIHNEKSFKFKPIPEPEPLLLENKKLTEKQEKLQNLKESSSFSGEISAVEHQLENIYEKLQNNQANLMLSAEEHAQQLGFSTSNEMPDIDLTQEDIDEKYIDEYLQTLHYPGDLEKILKKIELESRNIIQETGTNMLHLILGLLEWTESTNSEVKIQSPLICIPVTINRGSINKETNTYEYILEYSGDGLDTNKSLAEKLLNDFNLKLPDLDESMSFNEYIKEVSKLLKTQKNWRIKHEISLDFLNFAKILMYKDLDDSNWEDGSSLSENPILNELFIGTESNEPSYAPSEYDIDSHPVAKRIPLVLDADSSQHSAIVDVLEGKNVVIEGPPGTGKSQTISNMIAALLAEGKSILFVSEKLAALEVVHKRLSAVGLEDFCLELHSHKSQKIKILDSFKQRIQGRYKEPANMHIIKEKLMQRRKELQKHLKILHNEFGSCGKTLFDIFWTVEKYQKVSQYIKFDVETPDLYSADQIESIAEQLAQFQSFVSNYNFQEFYWYGYHLDKLTYIDIDIFLSKLKELNEAYKSLSGYYKELSQIINIDIENELKCSKDIEAFVRLTSLEVKDFTDKTFLQTCLDGGAKLLKQYVLLTHTMNSVYEKNSSEIVEFQSLDILDKEIISKFGAEHIELLNSLILRKKAYETLHSSLERILPDEADMLESDAAIRISSEVSSINEFLYEEISIDELKNIYALNDAVSSNMSMLENSVNTLARQIGISFNSEKFEIDMFIEAAMLLSQLEPLLYTNMHEMIGGARFEKTIEDAKREQEQVLIFQQDCERIFHLDNIVYDIQELQAIKQTLEEKKDSFFNFFSSDFKKAKKALDGLLIDVLPTRKSLWIDHMDKLIMYVGAKGAFENNLEHKNNFSSLFHGVDTDWKDIENLHAWAKTARKNIQINELLNLLLEGNEQTQTIMTSSLASIKNEMDTLRQNISEMQNLYSEQFYKKLLPNTENFNIQVLHEKLGEINNNLDHYLPIVSKYVKSGDESLSVAVHTFKNYNSTREKYLQSRKEFTGNIVELYSKELNHLTIHSSIDKILELFYLQNIETANTTEMIKEEMSALEKLNTSVENLKSSLDIDLEKSKDELLAIEKSLRSYKSIIESKISKEMQRTLILNFDGTFPLLNKIAEGYNLIESLHSNLEEFGTIQEAFFPASTKYVDYSLKLDLMGKHVDDLSVWLDYRHLISSLEERGLAEIINKVETKTLPHQSIISAFYYNFYFSLLRRAFKNYPLLNQFSRLSHEQVVEAFKDLDIELMTANRAYIASRASDRSVPVGQSGGSVKELTEKKLIEWEISKKKRHIPIRELTRRAGNAMKALKPCFMMSPLSVAQYLPPSQLEFDVLVVDEASQLRPEEALGVIARAKQIVIVGDPKQLPPTSFFDTQRDEQTGEETVVDESESILDTCIDLYKPVRRLRWHYRSQHESLIDFSNQRFYDNDLIVFPSPTHISDEEMGVKHTYVQNSLYQGRINKLEAKVVVQHLEFQMKNFPDKSIGVGTFNTTQRDLIQDMIDEKEKSNIFVENYISRWKNTSEPFFIKNLESLQGDERDVIFISTTYGPDKVSGKVFQRFGPINQEMGWRRLNVLITRSKQKMHVFTSMQSSDIIVSETSSRGVIALRGFLHFLETGKLVYAPEIIDGKGFDSPFEESVYGILSDAGIKSVPQVGVAGYFIDLAVVSEVSDDFILAIECDGATYHSSKSARDRDRLKQEVLERMGWTVYRIWSTDWFKNRDHEIAKLLQVVKEQQDIYTRKYKTREVTSMPSVNPSIVNDETSSHKQKTLLDEFNTNDAEAEVENSLQEVDSQKKFVSDEKIREMLKKLVDEKISKDFTIDKRCILSPLMIDQFIKYKPMDMDEFRSQIPMKLRTSINPEQLIYMPDIFEILELSDE